MQFLIDLDVDNREVAEPPSPPWVAGLMSQDPHRSLLLSLLWVTGVGLVRGVGFFSVAG